MSLPRVLCFGSIIAGLAVALFDAAHSTQRFDAAPTTIGDLWARVGIAHTKTLQYFSSGLLNHGIRTVSSVPVWLVFILLGIGIGLLACPHSSDSRLTKEQPKSIATRYRRYAIAAVVAITFVAVFALPQWQQPSSGSVFPTVGTVWNELHPSSLEGAIRVVVQRAPRFWDPAILTLLRLPAPLIILLLGFGLYRVVGGRRDLTPDDITEVEEDTLRERGPQPSARQAPLRSELVAALASCKGAFVSIGLFSGMVNVLMLTGGFFMLQVYDRVLPSRSMPTLVALAILVSTLYAFIALLDMIRSRIFVRIGASLNDALSTRVYDAVVQLPLKLESQGDGLQPVRDLDAVRSFLSSRGPTALFDLPWMPLYLGIIFAFHTVLGIAALIGAIILIALTLFTEALAREPMKVAAKRAQTRNGLAEASRRNAEVLAAMGMAERINARWSEANQSYLASHQKASDVTSDFGSISKALRMMLQSAMLGLGAYLVIHQEATAGIMIAAAILVARALAPVDLAIANWKGFLGARQSWKRLTQLLRQLPARESPMALPAPSTSLIVEQVSAIPPGQKKVVVQNMSLKLDRGQGLGIIGPSASGKSSFVRTIVGAWQPARGKVRLDGAALDQWPSEVLGRYVGYLPQDVELFAGTVAENISRFEAVADPKAILRAAQAAGVHDLIVALPQGYETEIGEQGQKLSAGQRQRIALARALYGEPFLVVLDEPSSNLDAEGEEALTHSILGVRDRGGIVIVVAHRPSVLAGVDLVLVMAKGTAVSFGPKDEVLAKVLAQRSNNQRPPLAVVPETGKKA